MNFILKMDDDELTSYGFSYSLPYVSITLLSRTSLVLGRFRKHKHWTHPKLKIDEWQFDCIY